jgi:hypothetical protein
VTITLATSQSYRLVPLPGSDTGVGLPFSDVLLDHCRKIRLTYWPNMAGGNARTAVSRTLVNSAGQDMERTNSLDSAHFTLSLVSVPPKHPSKSDRGLVVTLRCAGPCSLPVEIGRAIEMRCSRNSLGVFAPAF